MILHKTNTTLRGAGAFADVLDVGDGTVVKLFRRMEVTYDPIDDVNDHAVVIRATWDAEVKAYELAAPRPDLNAHLAPWHGRIVVADVLDGGGQSIGSQYHLDCGLRIGAIPGDAEKVAHLQDHPLFDAIDSYLDYICEAGITSPYDGSVFIPGLANEFTVIDIATWDAMAELSFELADTGRLSEAARRQWGAQ